MGLFSVCPGGQSRRVRSIVGYARSHFDRRPAETLSLAAKEFEIALSLATAIPGDRRHAFHLWPLRLRVRRPGLVVVRDNEEEWKRVPQRLVHHWALPGATVPVVVRQTGYWISE